MGKERKEVVSVPMHRCGVKSSKEDEREKYPSYVLDMPGHIIARKLMRVSSSN